MGYDKICKDNPRNMSASACAELMHHAVKHNTCYGLAGGVYVPKHHSFIHLTMGAPWAGNPGSYSTYQDEHENGLVARQGKLTHPFTFPSAVLRKQVARERLGL